MVWNWRAVVGTPMRSLGDGAIGLDVRGCAGSWGDGEACDCVLVLKTAGWWLADSNLYIVVCQPARNTCISCFPSAYQYGEMSGRLLVSH